MSDDNQSDREDHGREFDRRSLLKGVAAASAVVGFGGAGLSTRTAAQDGFDVTDLTSGDLSAEDLADLLVEEGGDIEVDPGSVTFDGDDRAGGTFTGGEEIIGFDGGIILSSGQVTDVTGPNDEPNSSTAFGTDGDEDLDELAAGTTQDAAILEFDFTVPEDVGQVTFNYVFGSEEYNEFVGSQFNDVFAFWVNDENCAVVETDESDDPQPVTINTINNGQPGQEPSNPELYINNDPFHPDADGETVPEDGLRDTQMDGFTVVLECEAAVNDGETNTMRLAIADTADSIYDSWVLLQAGSLAPPEEPTEPPEEPKEPEECTYDDITTECKRFDCECVNVCVSGIESDCPVTAELVYECSKCGTDTHTFEEDGCHAFTVPDGCTPDHVKFYEGSSAEGTEISGTRIDPQDLSC